MAILKSGGFFHGVFHRAIDKTRPGDTLVTLENYVFKKPVSLKSPITITSTNKPRTFTVPDDSVGLVIPEGVSGEFIFKNVNIVLGSKCNFLVIPPMFSGKIVFDNVKVTYKKGVDPRDFYAFIVTTGSNFSRLDLVFTDCTIDYLQNVCTTCHMKNCEIGDLFGANSSILSEHLIIEDSVTERLKIESRYIDVPMKLKATNLGSISHTTFIRCDGELVDSTVDSNDTISDEGTNSSKWISNFKDESLVIHQINPYIFIECGINHPFKIQNFNSNSDIEYGISTFLFDKSNIVFDNCNFRPEMYRSRAVNSDLRFENSTDYMEWDIQDVKLSNQNSTSSLFDGSSDSNVTEGTALERLNKMIGLKNVKTQVERMVSVAKVEAEKRKRGLQSTNDFSLHMVFGGRPGTGKTVVARLLGEAMYEEGILPTKNFVVASRSDLVDDKVGGSALKTKAVIEKAIGGVLFIDEAYMLASQGDNDFAEEVVAELIQAAENNRDELIVIMAGYTKDMVHFFETGNEGLRSRFTNWIEFPDYTAKELFQILKFQLQEADIFYSSDTAKVLLSEFKRLLSAELQRTGGYIDGNGRFVRNYKQELQMALSDRIAQVLTVNSNISNDEMRELKSEDIMTATNHMIKKL